MTCMNCAYYMISVSCEYECFHHDIMKIGGIPCMNQEIAQSFEKIENRIQSCEILSRMLAGKRENQEIISDEYEKMGYTQQEITTGVGLVNLYLQLQACSRCL